MSEFIRLPSGRVMNVAAVRGFEPRKSGGVLVVFGHGDNDYEEFKPGVDASALRAWMRGFCTLRTEEQIDGERMINEIRAGEVLDVYRADGSVTRVSGKSFPSAFGGANVVACVLGTEDPWASLDFVRVEVVSA